MGRRPDITLYVKKSWIFGYLAFWLSLPFVMLTFGNLIVQIIQIKLGANSGLFLGHLVGTLAAHSQNILYFYFAGILCFVINLVRFSFKIRERDVTTLIYLFLPLAFIWLRQNIGVGV